MSVLKIKYSSSWGASADPPLVIGLSSQVQDHPVRAIHVRAGLSFFFFLILKKIIPDSFNVLFFLTR